MQTDTTPFPSGHQAEWQPPPVAPDCWPFGMLAKFRAYLIPFSSSLPAVLTPRSHWLPEACGPPADQTLHISLHLLWLMPHWPWFPFIL